MNAIYHTTIIRRLRFWNTVLLSVLAAAVFALITGCMPKVSPMNEDRATALAAKTAGFLAGRYGIPMAWKAEVRIFEVSEARVYCNYVEARNERIVGCAVPWEAIMQSDYASDQWVIHELCHLGSYAGFGDIDAGHKKVADCYDAFAFGAR